MPVVITVAKEKLIWPVDLPVFPSSDADMSSSFEVVIEALAGNLVLAQTRARSSFLRGRRLLLPLSLSACLNHEPGVFCSEFGCVGEQCKVCDPAGACVEAGAIDPSNLLVQPEPTQPSADASAVAVDLPRDASIQVSSDAGSDAQSVVPIGCQPGLQGDGGCQNLNDCTAGACSNGSCVDGPGTFTCNCNAGFTGTGTKLCTKSVEDVCQPNPCLNGGTCSATGPLCSCAAGFSGAHCESACPASPSGLPGSTQSFTLNGRSYTLHIGSSVQPGKPSPLVVAYHDIDMTPAALESLMQMDPLADQEGFMVARPVGKFRSNVGDLVAWDVFGTSDLDLTRALIDDVHGRACVDRKRVYAAGFLQGASMAQSAGCRLGDVLAAIAAYSGVLDSYAKNCVTRAVPVYAFYGDADPDIAYSSAQNTVNRWVMHNACTGAPRSSAVVPAQCQVWTCAAGSEVIFCTMPGDGHYYLPKATAEFWSFFKQNPLP